MRCPHCTEGIVNRIRATKKTGETRIYYRCSEEGNTWVDEICIEKEPDDGDSPECKSVWVFEETLPKKQITDKENP